MISDNQYSIKNNYTYEEFVEAYKTQKEYICKNGNKKDTWNRLSNTLKKMESKKNLQNYNVQYAFVSLFSDVPEEKQQLLKEINENSEWEKCYTKKTQDYRKLSLSYELKNFMKKAAIEYESCLERFVLIPRLNELKKLTGHDWTKGSYCVGSYGKQSRKESYRTIQAPGKSVFTALFLNHLAGTSKNSVLYKKNSFNLPISPYAKTLNIDIDSRSNKHSINSILDTLSESFEDMIVERPSSKQGAHVYIRFDTKVNDEQRLAIQTYYKENYGYVIEVKKINELLKLPLSQKYKILGSYYSRTETRVTGQIDISCDSERMIDQLVNLFNNQQLNKNSILNQFCKTQHAESHMYQRYMRLNSGIIKKEDLFPIEAGERYAHMPYFFRYHMAQQDTSLEAFTSLLNEYKGTSKDLNYNLIGTAKRVYNSLLYSYNKSKVYFNNSNNKDIYYYDEKNFPPTVKLEDLKYVITYYVKNLNLYPIQKVRRAKFIQASVYLCIHINQKLEYKKVVIPEDYFTKRNAVPISKEFLKVFYEEHPEIIKGVNRQKLFKFIKKYILEIYNFKTNSFESELTPHKNQWIKTFSNPKFTRFNKCSYGICTPQLIQKKINTIIFQLSHNRSHNGFNNTHNDIRNKRKFPLDKRNYRKDSGLSFPFSFKLIRVSLGHEFRWGDVLGVFGWWVFR